MNYTICLNAMTESAWTLIYELLANTSARVRVHVAGMPAFTVRRKA